MAEALNWQPVPDAVDFISATTAFGDYRILSYSTGCLIYYPRDSVGTHIDADMERAKDLLQKHYDTSLFSAREIAWIYQIPPWVLGPLESVWRDRAWWYWRKALRALRIRR